MRTFFLLVIALAATGVPSLGSFRAPTGAAPTPGDGIYPLAPSINDQVDSVLEGGGLWRTLGCDSPVEDMPDFDIWRDAWWFWPEFYEGHITGLRDGFRRLGDCIYEDDTGTLAQCHMRYSGLRIHYRWRVGVKDLKLKSNQQTRYPLALIEAGTMDAKVAPVTTTLYLSKDPVVGYFRAKLFPMEELEVQRVAFSNSTIAWNDKLLDTKAGDFPLKLREMLAYWFEYYMRYMTFLELFNKAFVRPQQ